MSYSSWTTIDRLPSFMPAIAPITQADAALFAERYLEPEQRAHLLAEHNGGDTLAHWWPRLSADVRNVVFVDCMLSDGALPYGQRLEAVDRNPRRSGFLVAD